MGRGGAVVKGAGRANSRQEALLLITGIPERARAQQRERLKNFEGMPLLNLMSFGRDYTHNSKKGL